MAPRSVPEANGAPDMALLQSSNAPIKTRDGKVLRYSPAQVTSHIAKFAKADNTRALIELTATLALFLYMFKLSWWWLPLHSLVIMRLFIVGVHDPAHGALFSSQKLNTAVAVLFGPLTFMPGLWWQYGHGYHHEHSNDLDFDQSSQTAGNTVLDYLSWPAYYRALYRYFSKPYVLLTQTAPITMVIGQALKATTVIEWALQLGVMAVGWHYGVLFRHMATMGLAASLGVLLFHLQHTFDGARRAHGFSYFEAGYFGSSFLQVPYLMRPFTGAIEVHHIHHLNAKVPFYRLYECHRAAPPGMWDGIRTITFSEGLESLKYVLWDHVQDRLITLAELDSALSTHGEEGYKALQTAAMQKQVARREQMEAAKEKIEEFAKKARLEAARKAAEGKVE